MKPERGDTVVVVQLCDSANAAHLLALISDRDQPLQASIRLLSRTEAMAKSTDARHLEITVNLVDHFQQGLYHY